MRGGGEGSRGVGLEGAAMYPKNCADAWSTWLELCRDSWLCIKCRPYQEHGCRMRAGLPSPQDNSLSTRLVAAPLGLYVVYFAVHYLCGPVLVPDDPIATAGCSHVQKL